MTRWIPLVLLVLGSTTITHAAPQQSLPTHTARFAAMLLHYEIEYHTASPRGVARLVAHFNRQTPGISFSVHDVVAQPSGTSASPLAMPNNVIATGNVSQAHFGSGGGPFSNYHHTWGGFQDAVGAHFFLQPIMDLYYAGTVFSTPNAAAAFMADSYHTTAASSPASPTACGEIGYPCKITSGVTNSGDIVLYEVAQVKNCTIETGYQGNADEIDANSGDVSKLTADVFVLGVQEAAGACTGVVYASPAPKKAPAKPHTRTATTTHPAVAPKGFHGNCFTFRGALWTLNIKTSSLVGAWWTDLQAAYTNNYPVPSGGSVPGPTQGQFNQAQTYMNGLHVQLDDTTNHVGLEYDVVAVGAQYGIKSLNVPGPYAWAVSRVYGAMYSLDRAAYDEWKTPNSGLNDYHTAQQMLSNAWDAMKQLPCR